MQRLFIQMKIFSSPLLSCLHRNLNHHVLLVSLGNFFLMEADIRVTPYEVKLSSLVQPSGQTRFFSPIPLVAEPALIYESFLMGYRWAAVMAYCLTSIQPVLVIYLYMGIGQILKLLLPSSSPSGASPIHCLVENNLPNTETETNPNTGTALSTRPAVG